MLNNPQEIKEIDLSNIDTNFYNKFYNIHKSTLNRTNEKLMDKIESHKKEETNLKKEIEKIVEDEKISFFNKKTMGEVSELIDEYLADPKSLENFGNYGDTNVNQRKAREIMGSSEDEKNKIEFLIRDLIADLNELKNCTFSSISELDDGGHKSAEITVNDSNKKLRIFKDNFLTKNAVNLKRSDIIIEIMFKLIFMKIKVIEEQNLLIDFLIKLCNSMGKDLHLIYKTLLSKDEYEIIRNHYGIIENDNEFLFDISKQKKLIKSLIKLFLKDNLDHLQENQNVHSNKNSKFDKFKEGEIIADYNPNLKNNDILKDFVKNLNMDDLIVISGIPESDLDIFV
jgi:hypothetical protein